MSQKFDKAYPQFDFKTLQTVPFQTVIQSQTWFSNVNNDIFLDISDNVITRDQLSSHAENKLSETYPTYATQQLIQTNTPSLCMKLNMFMMLQRLVSNSSMLTSMILL